MKKCVKCGEKRADVQRRHMNTAYLEKELNYVDSCDPCFEEIERYWDEMWSSYYGGCY